MSYLTRGALAQLVEQRPEEPCVPSSSLGGATNRKNRLEKFQNLFSGFFVSYPSLLFQFESERIEKHFTNLIPLYILWYMSTLDKTIINIKVSKALKQDAQDLADEIGVPLTTVITASLKEFVRSRSLTVSAFPRLKPEIEHELNEAIADLKSSKNVSKILTKPDDIATHLKSL